MQNKRFIVSICVALIIALCGCSRTVYVDDTKNTSENSSERTTASTTEQSTQAAENIQKSTSEETSTIPQTKPSKAETTTQKAFLKQAKLQQQRSVTTTKKQYDKKPAKPENTTAVTTTKAHTTSTTAKPASDESKMISDMLAKVNAERKKAGLSPLVINKSLNTSAKVRANELLKSFSHTRPNGESCFTAIRVDYLNAGENIAYGYTDVDAVMYGWMHSEGHKANILSEKFNCAGFGMTRAKDGTMYWVQLFAYVQ